MSALPPKADMGCHISHVRFVPCVDGALLARVFVTRDAELVGAAMCSTC